MAVEPTMKTKGTPKGHRPIPFDEVARRLLNPPPPAAKKKRKKKK
jgi:hypothetical protein